MPASRLTTARSAGNVIRTTLLLGGLTALLMVVGRAIGGHGGMVFGFALAGLMNFAAYWWSDKLVLRMHRAQALRPGDLPGLQRAVARLAERAGLPMPRLYLIDDPSPNAFATGRNPAHAAVAVTTGLLDLMPEEEVEAVLAHELSHVQNRDILVSSVAATIAGGISLVARMAGWALMFGRRDDDDGGGLGDLFLIIVAPILALLIQMAISRAREYGADRTGAALLGTPWPLSRALERLGRASERIPMHSAQPATSHLYIMAPLAGRGGGLFRLFSTHPPIEERVRRLRAMA